MRPSEPWRCFRFLFWTFPCHPEFCSNSMTAACRLFLFSLLSLSFVRSMVGFRLFGCHLFACVFVTLHPANIRVHSFVRSFARSLSQAANFDLFKFLCLQLSYAVNKFLFYVFFLPSLHSMAVLFCLHVCVELFCFYIPQQSQSVSLNRKLRLLFSNIRFNSVSH